MRVFVRLVVSAIAAGVSAAQPPVQAVPRSEPEVATLLEQYSRGQTAAAIAGLTKGPDLRAAMRRFRTGAERWMDDDPSVTRHRLAVVATVVVDLSARAVNGEYDYETYGRSVRPLIEWACQRLRRETPSEFERLFHLATVAILQASNDNQLLVGTKLTFPAFDEPRVVHLRHGGDRFPDEGRFKLAWITSRRETQQISSGPVAPGYLFHLGAGRFPGGSRDNRDGLNRTIADLAGLGDSADVGAEARLRRGVLLAVLDRADDALPELEQAARTTDPFVRYVAHMMLGSIAERAGRLFEAASRFAAAAGVVPASSALIARAGVLHRLGQTGAASDLMDVWAATSRPPDPWQLYSLRDFRRLPGYLREMQVSIAGAHPVDPRERARPDVAGVGGDAGGPVLTTVIGAVPLDVSVVVQPIRRIERDAVTTYRDEIAAIAAMLGAGDRLRIVSAGAGGRELVPLTRPEDVRVHDLEFPDTFDCHAVYDALASVLVRPSPEGRRHVAILLSEGESGGNAVHPAAVEQLASRSGARLFVAVSGRDWQGRSRSIPVSRPLCTRAVMDWDPERQRRLWAIDSIPRPDEQQRALQGYERERLVAIARLTGGGELRAGIFRRSIVEPIRRMIESERARF